jgi:hypothetical protein
LTRVFEHVREHGHLYKSPHNTPSNLFNPHQHLQLLTFLLITLLVAAVTMRFTQAIALVLPALAAAYPGMAGSRAEMEEHFRAQMKREAEAEADPQLLNGLGNLVNGLGDSVKGLLNSVGQAIVVKSNKRPELPGTRSRRLSWTLPWSEHPCQPRLSSPQRLCQHGPSD